MHPVQRKFLIHLLYTSLLLLCLASCVTTSLPKIQNETPEELYRQASAHYQKGDTATARRLFTKITLIDSSYADAYKGLSAISYDQAAYEKSTDLLKKHIALQPSPEPIIWHRLGLTGWYLQDYDQALEGFETYLKNAPPNSRLVTVTEKYVRDSRYLQELGTPVARNDRALSPAINTAAAEYLPALPADGERMIFTRRVRGQEDFFLAQKVEDVWVSAEPIDELNTSENEGAHFLSVDGRTLLFTRCGVRDDYGSCDLYFTTSDGKQWQAPRNLGPQVNTNAWESQPCLSADGKRLFFSSNRPGGKGGRDIWYLDRTKDGWSAATNLAVVNTVGNEESPYLHPDGHSLYFMSNGHPGHGGYDLFYHDLAGDQAVVNLGGSVNTREDEGAMSITLDGKTGYFARTVADDPARLNIDIFETPLPSSVRSVPTIFVEMEVYDAVTKERLATTALVHDLLQNKTFSSYRVSATGQSLVTLPSGGDYSLRIDKPGYTFYSQHIDLSQQSTKLDPIRLQVLLSPINNLAEDSEPIILRNIFFASGSADLLNASFAELDFLKTKMDKNAEMKIIIQGHTDDVGSAADNQRLSEARAKSVYDYLVTAGIDPARMQSRGFGEDRPLSPNMSEEGRKQNRRTEFVIVDSF